MSAVSVLVGVFNDNTGNDSYFGVGKNERYHRVPGSELRSRGLYQEITSANLYSSSDADTTLLLFGPQSPIFGAPSLDYQGVYAQLTNQRSGNLQHFDLTSLIPGVSNPLVSSLLVVATNRKKEYRVSFRDAFLSTWNKMLDAKLSGTPAHRTVDPTLTWEMFPEGVSRISGYLDSNLTYLEIFQPLVILLDFWPPYQASITYDLYLYLDGGGRLQGYVAGWSYWVEDGVKKSGIEQQLAPVVEVTAKDDLNKALAASLAKVPLTFKDLYYLPGKQLEFATTGAIIGNTTDDATIVLEHV